MFDAWAETVGVRLFPGTAYLCADVAIEFPPVHISLDDFEHLHSVPARREQAGYAPRLYPVALANCLLAWVYRWSDDDARLDFVGDLEESCEASRVLEIVAPVSIKQAVGVNWVSLRFLGP
jgi:hypothetical protein